MKTRNSVSFISAMIFFCAQIAPSVSWSAELANKRYVDPDGFFTIVPPANWQVKEYPQDPRGKAAFLAPKSNVELRVLVATEQFDKIDDLVSGAKGIEKRIGQSTNIEKTTFFGRPAIKRSFIFNGVKLLAYDFLIGNVHHNIQYGAPPSDYFEYLSLANKSMETYDASVPSGSEKKFIEYKLSGKRRLAELLINNGQLELAQEYIDEGLALDPSDSRLLELAAKIKTLK